MKKIILNLLIINIIFALTKNNHICQTNYINKSLFGKTITNIKREINFSKEKINIIEKIKISTCPKKFFIIGSYICEPTYKGTIYITGNYKIKNNKIIINNKNINIKDDLKFKQKIEKEKGYNNCYEKKQLSKYCYKAKSFFEKQWNKKRKQIKNIYKKNIILNYKNNPFSIKDNIWNKNFKCK